MSPHPPRPWGLGEPQGQRGQAQEWGISAQVQGMRAGFLGCLPAAAADSRRCPGRCASRSHSGTAGGRAGP